MANPIKLFPCVQECFRFMGIFPFQSNRKCLSTNLIRAIFLICCVQWMLTTAAFFVFAATSMFEYGFAFCMLNCIIADIVVYLIFIWQSDNALKFFEKCEGFIKQRVRSTAAYMESIGKIELLNKLLSYAMCISTALLFFSTAPYTYVRYYLLDMGTDSYFLFSPVWCPFDWKTPIGYLVAWFAQWAGDCPVACIFIQFLNFVFGSGWLFICIAEDIGQDVDAFNSIAKTASGENHTELTKRFRDIIQTYTDAKKCIHDFNQLAKYSLFTFFSWSFFGLAAVLASIQFQLWADDPDFFKIGLLLFVLVWTTTYISILCEPGARLTDQFEVFNNKLSQCDWYSLPVKMHRMYMIFLSDTQHPAEMSSFANITCERETFKKIINGAFSYFMTFRRFRT